MGVLRQSIGALTDGGVLLDLQSVPPEPTVESDGAVLGALVSPAFWALADANNVYLDALVADGVLVEEVADRFDVLHRWPSGVEIADDWNPARRTVPEALKEALRAIEGECVIRDPCLTRRFRYRVA